MRMIRFVDDAGHIRLGLEPRPGQPAELLEGDLFRRPRPSGQTARVAKLLAPLQPVNIICIGANYRQHCIECGSPIPELPVIFMKPNTAANHPGDPIRIPAACTHGPEVDFECELVVVIGKDAFNVSQDSALDHVLGYTCGNDITARRWQKHGGGGQWVRGKGFHTFAPLGPVLVTADDIPDPQALRLKTTLNGQVMQDDTTADMIFNVRFLISYLSQDTLIPAGTVLFTGTPHGVGVARTPPVFLKPGDTVTVEIEKIGQLTNPVAAAK